MQQQPRVVIVLLVFVVGLVLGSLSGARLQATSQSTTALYLPALVQHDGPAATATTTAPTTTPLPLAPPLVFVSYRDGNAELYSAQANGTALKRLTTTAAREAAPRISPDGASIVFVSDRAGNDDIYRMKADGTDVVQLTSSTDIEGAPSWSPDGTQIVFEAQRNNRWLLYLMHADGSDQKAITFANEDNRMPQWSPDGQYIAYVHLLYAGGDKRGELQLLRPDNLFGTVYLVVDYTDYLENPVWSPQSTLIAFDADSDGDGRTELLTVTIEDLGLRFGKITTIYDAKDPTIDVVMGAWTKDATALVASQVELVARGYNRLLTPASLVRVSVADSTAQTVLNSGIDWQPDVCTCTTEVER